MACFKVLITNFTSQYYIFSKHMKPPIIISHLYYKPYVNTIIYDSHFHFHCEGFLYNFILSINESRFIGIRLIESSQTIHYVQGDNSLISLKSAKTTNTAN